MKNILLIGDSIRIGYDKSVRDTLKDIANVYFPDENCRFASYVLRYIHEYKNLVGNNTGMQACGIAYVYLERIHIPL